MKKIIAVLALSLMTGCATVTQGFFGANMVDGSIIARGSKGSGCALVEGWGVKEITGEDVNCLCLISVINDSTKAALQMAGFAPISAFFVTDKEMCDPNHKTE
jgi:hypothetical protein